MMKCPITRGMDNLSHLDMNIIKLFSNGQTILNFGSLTDVYSQYIYLY